MNTREILMMKTLQFKSFQDGRDDSDLAGKAMAADPELADQYTKNVCARLPLELAHEMEQICGILSLNKRELITLAVRDFHATAKAILYEFEAIPSPEITKD